jgi:hypothetical protein
MVALRDAKQMRRKYRIAHISKQQFSVTFYTNEIMGIAVGLNCWQIKQNTEHYIKGHNSILQVNINAYYWQKIFQ